jgi:hypothetical protein
MHHQPSITWIVIEQKVAPPAEPKSRPQRILSRFVEWLTDPIPFPGKWPISAALPEDYNLENDLTLQPTGELDERRAPEPRSIVGSR